MSEGKPELVVLNISCGNGISDEVSVHFGDSADELAVEFVEKHNLKPSYVTKVCNHIQKCMEVYLENNPAERKVHETMLKKRLTNKGVSRSSAVRVRAVRSGSSESATETNTVSSSSKSNRSPNNSESNKSNKSNNKEEEQYNQLRSSYLDENTDNNFDVNASYDSTATGSQYSAPRVTITREIAFSASKAGARRGSEGSSNVSAGGTHHDRMHRDAEAARKRREGLISWHAKKETEQLKQQQYKVSYGSRALLQQNGWRSGGKSTLDRLYTDGVKKQAARKEHADSHPHPAPKEDWSCARCGLFHALPEDLEERWRDRGPKIGANDTFSPDREKNGKNKGKHMISTGPQRQRRGGMVHEMHNDRVLECPSCGFVQGSHFYSTPKLHVSDRLATGSESHLAPGGKVAGTGIGAAPDEVNKTEKWRRERERELHHAARVARKRLEAEEAKYIPIINAKSREIVEAATRRETEALLSQQQIQIQQMATGGKDKRSLSLSGGGTTNHLDMAENVPMGEYFQQPVLQRLAENKRPIVPSSKTHPQHAGRRSIVISGLETNNSNGQSNGNSDGNSKKSVQQHLAFVERLNAKHRLTQEQIRLKGEQIYSVCDKTGQPLFTPKLPTGPLPHQRGMTQSVSVAAKDSNGQAQPRYQRDRKFDEEQLSRMKEQRDRAAEDIHLAITHSTLPRSEKLLEQAEIRTLYHTFQILCSGPGGSLEGNKDELKEEGYSLVADEAWKDGQVDLSAVNANALVPSLLQLLQDLRFEVIRAASENRASSNGTSGADTGGDTKGGVAPDSPGFTDVEEDMRVGLPLFSFLVRQVAARRSNNTAGSSGGGTGGIKPRLIVPESHLQLQRRVYFLLREGLTATDALQLAGEEDSSSYNMSADDASSVDPWRASAELRDVVAFSHREGGVNPFSPYVNPVPIHISDRRQGRSIEDILLAKGEASEKRLIEAKVRILEAEHQVHPFQPKMFRPPPELAHVQKRIDDAPVVARDVMKRDVGTNREKEIKARAAADKEWARKRTEKQKKEKEREEREREQEMEREDGAASSAEEKESSTSSPAVDASNASYKNSNNNNNVPPPPKLVTPDFDPLPPPLPVEVGASLSISLSESQTVVAAQLKAELFGEEAK